MFNRHIFITGLALFAMFFGAGNLIFPVMMGINAGTSVGWALLGFCLTGIALPAIALVAATSASDSNPMSIVMRLGRIPGQGILWIIFLTTGALRSPACRHGEFRNCRRARRRCANRKK